MGIIKAFFGSMGGALGDQWQEVIEADQMTDTTVFTKGVKVRANDKRNSNKKGTEDIVSNGSIIHVYPNQFMILVDGGKIVDYTAEEGYYKVENSSAPSLFNGQFGDTLKEAFGRVRYAGVPSQKQQVFYVNLQEIKGIKFGTPTPVNYFDNFYNSELFLRAHGTYSIKVTDPIKFFAEAIPRNAARVDIKDINEQYLSEFLEALQAAINQMSVDNIRISQVVSKTRELSRYMATELDEDWKNLRGFEVQSVGIASVSYDEESKKLINLRNQGAMMGDPAVREGYVQSAIARGMEAAGNNSAGAAQAFMGMGMGMGAAGNFMASASATNTAQMQQQAAQRAAAEEAQRAANTWTCSCGASNTGKFCSECGSKKPEAASGWTCSCGKVNTGKFCSECGSPRPADEYWFCTECGHKNTAASKFCSECGNKKG
ncbi:MAG: SPFH domain-containing protein [Clostridia bacterium]|nr:SPFH domain-containing protein [Clostridia bacterium]